MWTLDTSWFTPTVLFCLLNLTIGTIFISSRHSHKKQQSTRSDGGDQDHNQPQFFRAPSILDRVRSINFSNYRSEHSDHPQLVRTPSILERVMSIKSSLFKSEQPEPNEEKEDEDDEEEHHLEDEDDEEEHYHEDGEDEEEHHHAVRTKSDTTGKARAGPVRLRKSASERIMMAAEDGEEEEVVLRRPATVREHHTASFGDRDEEVDAKADDFINRFKQQLKLQRLDSIIRYNDMLKRGASK